MRFRIGELCHQYFCHLYYQQCQRQGCLGCLNQLRSMRYLIVQMNGRSTILDLNFSPRHLTNLVNDNPVETQIVQVSPLKAFSLLDRRDAHRVNIRPALLIKGVCSLRKFASNQSVFRPKYLCSRRVTVILQHTNTTKHVPHFSFSK